MNGQKSIKYIPPPIFFEKVRQKSVLLALFFLPFIALNPGFNFNIGDIFLLIAFALSILKFRLVNRVQIVLLLFMFSILISIWLSLFWRGSQIEITNYAQFFFIFALLVPFGYTIFRDIRFDSIARVMVLSGVINAFFAVIQFLFPGFGFLSGQKIIKVLDLGFRATGLVTNPNELGFVLNMSLIMCLYLIITEKSRIMRILYIGTGIFIVIGTLSSIDRSSLFILPIVLLLYLWGMRKIKIVIIAASILIFAIGLFSFLPFADLYIKAYNYRISASQGTEVRLQGYKDAIGVAEEWFLAGSGIYGDEYSIHTKHRIHNQVLGLAIQSGIIPAFLFLTASMLIALHWYRESKYSPMNLTIFVLFLSSLMLSQIKTQSFYRVDYIPMILGIFYMIYGNSHHVIKKKFKNEQA